MPNKNKSSRGQKASPKKSLAPLSTHVRLSYAAVKSIAGVMGVCNTVIFRANDLYDPDYSGVGHQALGFDQLCNFYSIFRVVRSVITVTPCQDNTSSLTPGLYGIYLSTTGTFTNNNDPGAVFEQPSGVVTAATPYGQSQPSNWKSRSLTYVASEVWGKESTDLSVCCKDTGSPASVAYFEVFNASLNATIAGTLNILARIEFEVECSGRVPAYWS